MLKTQGFRFRTSASASFSNGSLRDRLRDPPADRRSRRAPGPRGDGTAGLVPRPAVLRAAGLLVEPSVLVVPAGPRGGRRTAGADVEAVQRELLDPSGTGFGVLNADDAILVSLMPSPYRAAALARAHNDWIRERWLERDVRLRGAIVCPAQDPNEAAREIRRAGEDPRFVQVVLCGGSERPYGEPRYLRIFEAAAELGLPVAIHAGARGWGSRRRRRRRPGHLLHRVAHARIGLQHHGPPRLPARPRDPRAAALSQSAPDRGWDRLAAGDPL